LLCKGNLFSRAVALINQSSVAKSFGTVGFANPTLYAIARNSSAYASGFHDVTVGSNPGMYVTFNATTGFDLVTGLGSPKCSLVATMTQPVTFAGAPSVNARGTGVLEVFAQRADTLATIHEMYGNGQAFGVWKSMPAITATSSPSSVSWSTSRIDTFVKGANSELEHTWSDDQGSTWASWENLGCCFDTAPSVASWGPNRLDVFMGSSGSVWHKTFASTWSSWVNLGGTVTSAPAAVSWGPNRLDVFARGASNELTHRWSGDGSTWSSTWENLGCCFDTGPGVASWAANRLDVFLGSGGTLHHTWYQNTWLGWDSLGGSITSSPSATSWAANRIDVMARGQSNELVHIWYNNQWQPWETLHSPKWYRTP
jgi:hypothetical protein